MDESAKPSSGLSSGKLIGLILAAVVLAEGIWGILVSLTRSLLLPLLARVLGGDPQSPLYLGKGDLSIPDLFGAVVQLCLAGIVFLLIRSWAAKPDRTRMARVQKAAPRPVPSAVADNKSVVAVAQAASAANVAPVVPATPAQSAAPIMRSEKPPASTRPASAKPAETPKPQKPEKPREVYYNLVGEPINPTEDE